MAVRCATLNLEHGRPAQKAIRDDVDVDRQFAEAVTQLRQVSPDILTVQEADGPTRARLTRPHSQHAGHVETLGRWLHMQHVYAPSAFGYGVGILSAYPIRAARYLRLPPIVKPIYRTDDGLMKIRWPEPRVALYGLVETPDGLLLVGTTHLDIDQNSAPRQLEIVIGGFVVAARAWGVSPTHTPMLLTGDMNLRPDAVRDALDEIPKTMTFPHTVLASAPTYPHAKPRWQIDHILGYRIASQRSHSLSTAISDHVGLVVEVVLR
ncbi:endonuclease/exonuclease/phosphatase family protein [Arcanobacterium phocisimile]|uniref:Endonuclease/exonuclease/phosphatase family protein n=1 Tax=Arcanobacterium phocisimile TaxID=1302235 RepID=A0ABX7IJW0_9ACTO|nr:endonuclease/exonuclease/phosphatase family protein [Arcanobacterium phocisimile]QRV02390.1 endonuclease/exonuclease/phosphatase family protein [Arcanobacterium phocisimile]